MKITFSIGILALPGVNNYRVSKGYILPEQMSPLFTRLKNIYNALLIYLETIRLLYIKCALFQTLVKIITYSADEV